MRPASAHRFVATLAAILLAAPPAPADDLAARARALLDDGSPAAGFLELSAVVELGDGPASRPDLLPATLELSLPGFATAGGRLDLVLLLASFELDPVLLRLTERLPPAETGAAPRVRLRFEVAEEIDRVVVAAALDGRWGAVDADLEAAGDSSEQAPVLAEWDLRADRAAPVETPVLRLLPPFDQPVIGTARIRVLISDPTVAKVAFELDGTAVVEDDRPPFAAEIDFGADGAVHELRAIGYDRAGRRVGEDRLTINDRGPGNRIRLDELEVGRGLVVATARLELAGAAPPRHVEFYLNERPLARLTAPPWRAELPRPKPLPSDFVRVVAVFADGSEVEDARLVEAAAERVEVNLVQVFAVVTDRNGSPQRDLTRDDFELRLAGRTQPIDRFAPAEQVPLVLGLVIDTSGSMWTLMPDTRQAGSRFLVQTLRAGDRAFLVDFDTRPRLAAPLTADLGALLRRFAGLTAEGFTALYDAVIFSMLQFEREGGRKALVVLTDGDDYRSKFGAKRCIEYGRELGVPVYIIALGGMFGERRDIKKLDLESLAGSTGGRVFYIDSSEKLGAAYDLIQQELRSQYLLAFNSPRPLTPDELAKIKVEVRSGNLRVRAVAGVE
jgi:VWFA-related protein